MICFFSLEADLINSTAGAADGGAAVAEGYEPWQKTLIGASAGALSLATIAGNLMVMISFKMDRQLRTISNYFLFSLAVADFIIGEQTQHLPGFSTYQVWNFSVWLEKMSPIFQPRSLLSWHAVHRWDSCRRETIRR